MTDTHSSLGSLSVAHLLVNQPSRRPQVKHLCATLAKCSELTILFVIIGFDTDSTSDSDYSLQTKRSRRDSFESAFSYKKQYPPHISTADNDDVYKRLYSPPPVLTKHALHRPTATTHSDDDYEFYDDVDDDDEDDNDDEATWRERSGDKHIDLPVMLDHIFTNTHSNDLPFYAILTKFYDTTTNPMDLNIDKLYDFLQAEIKITNVEEHVQLDITQIIEAANRAYLNRMQVYIYI